MTRPTPPPSVATEPLHAVREEVACVLGRPPEELEAVQRLGDDLDVDSVMLIEMKCGLERRYPELAEVPLADVFLGCGTLGELAERVADLVGLPVT